MKRLFQAVRNNDLETVKRILEGADPNRADNRKRNSWDWAIQTYLETKDNIEDAEQRDLFTALANELFGALYKYNTDILNIDRARNELKKIMRAIQYY